MKKILILLLLIPSLSWGQGTLTYANGDKYVGEFKNNVREGQGTMITTDGTT